MSWAYGLAYPNFGSMTNRTVRDSAAGLAGWAMDTIAFKAGGWLTAAMLALAAAAVAADFGFAVQMVILALAAFAALIWTVTQADYGVIAAGQPACPVDVSRYDDDAVRWGVIATVGWAVVGLLAGLYIALQLAFKK